ncbi:dickkopf-related protein 3b [Gadus morhua]|uniref:dickkopf-related protein 3b n=1 Tax=Gadus morhua TaxID=8049 RepID=UPI0011B59A45|nr:dickkopf-related protein 3-like [Gadus morhua]XP_056454199.1 dickkopf-related protein 3b isoform X1 [Gadus chalcogrammus]
MQSVVLLLNLGFSLLVAGGSVEDAVERGPVSLNDMFREVEMLMEDTQQMLEEAVDQISTESAKSSLSSLALPGTFHNYTFTNDKESNNGTRESHLSHAHVEISSQWNNVDHECMIDEDCGDTRYCFYEIEKSKCLPCIPTDMPCTKDEECCSDQMCVWGQCTEDATSGTEGTICQSQSDCRPDLCCAFQRELLFPVCNPRPEKGESCVNHPNLLMDLLSWDTDGPRDHCPCAGELQCQPHGRGFHCGE